MAMSIAKNIGPNQCTAGGPKLVAANPARPMVSRGATVGNPVSICLLLDSISVLTEEQQPEAGFRLQTVGILLLDLSMLCNDREKEKISDKITDHDPMTLSA